jgi:hypothetical protein
VADLINISSVAGRTVRLDPAIGLGVSCGVEEAL